ncbi:MAG TPA: type II toxin-antitoxin system VapC family toxin [Burkholderiales bacterium]|nr:type II toxin-antitoxin system VapC family toxin [Burkholderiales bacterium]
MIALDTNILARYLLDDEPAQARAARRLLADAKSEYWIPVTVVLELAWVLRKADAPRRLVMERLRDLLSLRNVRAQNADLVFQALRWAAQGMDLADALHLVLSGKAERFATFDEALVKQARKLGVQPPVSAP